MPAAEYEILTALRDDDGVTKDWVVLHSLDIRRHVSKLQGEADLIILAPGLGILCVEVKGCDVSRRNGVWIYGYDPPASSREGPFKQASTAMHSIRKHLDARSVASARNKYMASCVIFTNVDFAETSIEWNPWELINRRDIHDRGIIASIVNVFEAGHRSIAAQKRDGKQSAQWYDTVSSRPAVADVERIMQCLRPDFGYEESSAESVKRAEQVVSRFTEEQVLAAMGAIGNPRVVFEGAAGTGKTYMALYLARHWAQQGLRVGLLCFNSRLGRWLAREAGNDQANGFAGTFHGLCRRIVGANVEDPQDAAFWKELPGRARDFLITSDKPVMFDFLVVDEAQDLLDSDHLDVLDLLLEGGLSGGRWAFMGDFARQAIYASGGEGETLLQRLRQRGVETATYRLQTNCRNAPRVAANVSILGGLSPGYPRTLNATVPGDVQPHFHSGAGNALSALKDVLMRLLRAYKPEQIVILSPQAAQSSAARLSALDPSLPLAELPNDGVTNGKAGFCTIQSFKGMEAPVVVLTDIGGWDDPYSEALFYIGISRARMEVHLVLEESLRPEYIRRIRN